MSTLALPAPRERRAIGRRAGRVLRGAAGVILLLAAWQISVPLVGLSPYFYPAPGDVVAAFAELMRKGILPVYFADSMQRYFAGLGAGGPPVPRGQTDPDPEQRRREDRDRHAWPEKREKPEDDADNSSDDQEVRPRHV